jgi:hypothetical protein
LGRGDHDVLEIVEHEEQILISEVVAQAVDQRHVAGLADPERASYCREDERRVGDRRQGDDGAPVIEGTDQTLGDMKGQARFTDARRPN